jgi:hypothetical protein
MVRSLTSARVGPDSDPDRYLLLRPLPGPSERVVRYRGHDTSSGAQVDVFRVDDSELHRPATEVEGRVQLVQAFEGSVGHGVGRRPVRRTRWLVTEAVDGPTLRSWLRGLTDGPGSLGPRILERLASSMNSEPHGMASVDTVVLSQRGFLLGQPWSTAMMSLDEIRQSDVQALKLLESALVGVERPGRFEDPAGVAASPGPRDRRAMALLGAICAVVGVVAGVSARGGDEFDGDEQETPVLSFVTGHDNGLLVDGKLASDPAAILSSE